MFATAANVKESGPARWPPALLHDRFDYPVGGCVPHSTLSTPGVCVTWNKPVPLRVAFLQVTLGPAHGDLRMP